MVKNLKNKFLVLGVVSWFSFYNASPAFAGFVSSIDPASPKNVKLDKSQREAYIKTIEKALETKAVKEKLKEYGMSPAQIKEKLKSMNDQDLKLLANSSNKLLEGGDGLGVLLALLIILLIVLVVLKITGKEVIIR